MQAHGSHQHVPSLDVGSKRSGARYIVRYIGRRATFLGNHATDTRLGAHGPQTHISGNDPLVRAGTGALCLRGSPRHAARRAGAVPLAAIRALASPARRGLLDGAVVPMGCGSLCRAARCESPRQKMCLRACRLGAAGGVPQGSGDQSGGIRRHGASAAATETGAAPRGSHGFQVALWRRRGAHVYRISPRVCTRGDLAETCPLRCRSRPAGIIFNALRLLLFFLHSHPTAHPGVLAGVRGGTPEHATQLLDQARRPRDGHRSSRCCHN